METERINGTNLVDMVMEAVMVTAYVAIAITIIVTVTIAVCTALRKYSLKNIEYKRYFSQEGAFEGQKIYLIEEFSNLGVLPMFFVKVETQIISKLKLTGCVEADINELSQTFISRFFVFPYTKIRRKHEIICEKRGCYKLESAKLCFMRLEMFLDSYATVHVYPKELEAGEINLLNQSFASNTISRYPLIRDPFNIAKVREYAAGDTVGMINHKATAKMSRLMVNERENIQGNRLKIYLNFQQANDGTPMHRFEQILEKAMSIVSYMALQAQKWDYTISYSANSRMETDERYICIREGSGYEKYIEIMEALAMTRCIYGNSIGFVMNKDIDSYITNTQIVIISAYVDEAIESRINMLKSMGNTVKVINLMEVAGGDS